jgi:hypothetical protein
MHQEPNYYIGQPASQWVADTDAFIGAAAKDGVRVDIEPEDNGLVRTHFTFASGEELQRVFCREQESGAVYEIDHNAQTSRVCEGLSSVSFPLTCSNIDDLPELIYQEVCKRIPNALVISSELYNGLAIE